MRSRSSIDEIVVAVQEALASGITEVHMVGGLASHARQAVVSGPAQPSARSRSPAAAESFYGNRNSALGEAHISRPRSPETLAILREAGLGSLTGGGAEIFDPAVRDELCRGKESAAEWLEVHRTWHKMGGRSTCTMLYGHIETHEQRVDHLRQFRELQDETGGFTGFIPFAFEPESTVLSHIPRATAFEQLRNLAVSRLYLDNIRPSHRLLGEHGIASRPSCVWLRRGRSPRHDHAGKNLPHGGCETPEEQTVEALRHAIREAGREPVQRDSYYNHLTPAKSAPAGPRPQPSANWSASDVAALAAARLGCVKYLNARPLIDGWSGEVRFDHPSTLCRQLAAGELDVALVSSFEYLRNPIYSVVDRVAIASDGPVFSVILAHRGPIEQLREVVVDPASQTSVNLLRCLLGEREMTAEFVSQGDISAERGLLLIGDQAIRFRQQAKGDYQFLDLGAEWKKTTGKPFVYALWLIHPDYAGKRPLRKRSVR